MHERSLMKSLIDQLERIAAREGAQRVVGVRVHLGALSHFSPGHFREHFDEAARGGISQGARLDVEVGTNLSAPGADGVSIRSVDLAWEPQA